MHRRVVLLGYASGIGARDPGCSDGPLQLRTSGLDETLRARGVNAVWGELYFPEARPDEPVRETVHRLNKRLTLRVTELVREGDCPLVLGGDHSSAVGTWRGALSGLGEGKRLGLLWIDAHLDAHTPETTPSGMLHGMPLAILLGRLGRRGPGQAVLLPEHVAIVGARSHEAEETALLRSLGVRIYPMDEIEQRGVGAVLHEALDHVARDTDAYGITLDVDALDPTDAPGVGTPETGGLRARALIPALATITTSQRPIALEIAEFNPQRDHGQRTQAIVHEIAAALTGAEPRRSPMELEARYGPGSERPLPIVLVRGEGAWLWDRNGRRYLDMLAGAASHGHAHPRLLHALGAQAQHLAMTAGECHNDRLPPYLARLCQLFDMDRALPLNTGTEAVEAALAAAHRWAHTVKGTPAEQAEIVVCAGSVYGRSSATLRQSEPTQCPGDLSSYASGFRPVPYGDIEALASTITPRTAAFLVEPIRSADITVPPDGYLRQCARLCRDHELLLLVDERETGLGRTGALLACDHEQVQPDGLILGHALGGGLLSASAFLARDDVMRAFQAADGYSSFSGNPLAAAVAMEALDVMQEEHFAERALALGERLCSGLLGLQNPLIREVRGRGLLLAMTLDTSRVAMPVILKRLLAHGILARDAGDSALRFSPPLVIEATQVDGALERIDQALEEAVQADSAPD